jgi:hypothetical protein
MSRTSSRNATVGASWREVALLALLLAFLLPWGQVHHHSHDAADLSDPEVCDLCVLGQGGVLMPPATVTASQVVPRRIGPSLREESMCIVTLPDCAAQPRPPPFLA